MSIICCYTIINIFSRKNVNIFKANLAIFLISSFGSVATTIEALAYKNLLKHLEIEVEEMQCFIRDFQVAYNIPKKINSKAMPLKAFWLGNHHLLCRWSFTILRPERV